MDMKEVRILFSLFFPLLISFHSHSPYPIALLSRPPAIFLPSLPERPARISFAYAPCPLLVYPRQAFIPPSPSFHLFISFWAPGRIRAERPVTPRRCVLCDAGCVSSSRGAS
ncbi:hypothetical protein C8R44DRAFT_825468, partial [Mycena epipterygia]